MKVVRTAIVALCLLLLDTWAIQAEPSQDPPASHTALPAPEPTPSPAAAPTTVNESSEDRLRHAIELAAGFLGIQQLHGDEAWIVTQGANLLGPKFTAWARTLSVFPAVVTASKQSPLKAFPLLLPTEGRIWALRGLPQRGIITLPKPNAASVADVESRHVDNQSQGDLILVTILSAACRELTPKLRSEWLKCLAKDKHAYVLIGQLSGAMLGYNQGCLSPSVLKPIRRHLATSMFEELRADIETLDDLEIQRIATLCYAGVCDWIDPELIARLVTEQQPDGSWGWRDPHISGMAVGTTNHTAANAFYVLARSWSLRHASSRAIGPKPPGIK